jgi:hypothetical protein
MSRIAVAMLCGLLPVLGGPVAVAADTPVDSKAWERAHTSGPPTPVDSETQRAKLATLEEMIRGLRPIPGVAIGAPGAAPVRLVELVTVRPFGGAELAAAEARIRAKLAATARPAPAPRWLGSVGPLPPKPRELSTSVPLTGDDLVRSLEREREKVAAPASVTRGQGAPGVARLGAGRDGRKPSGTSIPGTPLDADQRAKLEAARAGATPTPQDRP